MKTFLAIIVLGSSLAFAGPSTKSDRTLNDFMVIQTERMTASQILERFGKPDRDVGSGIYIYEYDLSDGRKIRIYTPDKKVLMAATCHDPKTDIDKLIFK